MFSRFQIKTFVLVAVNFWCSISSNLTAQQDSQFTQYMYATQVFNPGYISSKNTSGLSVLGRWQWAGIEGAPRTATLVGNIALGAQGKSAIGLSIIQEEIGPIAQTDMNIDYAYRIYFNNNHNLSFGLKSGINYFSIDFNKLNIADRGDVFERYPKNNLRLQTGAGIYYHTENFYLGISTPNLLNNFNLQSVDLNSTEVIATERIHYYMMGGYIWSISENLKMKPATLVKLVEGAPIQWDFSSNWLLYDKIIFGISYRWSASVSALSGYQVNDKIFLGFAFDYSTNEFGSTGDGSYEFLMQFNLFNRRNCKCSPNSRFY